MPGAIPSGANPAGWTAATGANPGSGYDATAVVGALIAQATGAGTPSTSPNLPVGISNLKNLTQAAVTAAYQEMVQANSVWTALSQQVFAGLNPNGTTPLPLLMMQALGQAFGISPSALTSVVNVLTEIESLFANIPGESQLVQAITGSAGNLAQLQQFFTNVRQFFSVVDFTSSSFSPATAAQQFVQDVLLPTNLFTSSGGMDWGALVLALFGVSGGSQSLATTLGTNLMKLLGNVNLNPSGTFDPIAAAQQWLQQTLVPAGALSTTTQIPAHLLGNLAPGSLTNLLPDPGFDDSSMFDGQSLWEWDGTVGRTNVGSAKTTAAGVLRQLIGVPIKVGAGQTLSVGVYTQWSGVTASGQAISLALNAYDANNDLITDPNRIVKSISNPAASSGWQQLSGSYRAPANTAYVRLSLEVDAAVTAGTVWFDDTSMMSTSGLLDASLLANIENIPQLAPTSVQGVSGLVDLLTTFEQMFNGLGSAYSGQQLSGVGLARLFSLAQATAQNASLAISQAVSAAQTLGNRTNKPVFAGMNPTSEATFPLSDLPHGTAMPTTSVAAGASVIGMLRAAESATKGFVEFLAQGNGGTSIFVNVFKVNPSNGNKTALWNSADISSQVPNGSLGYVRVLIPGASQPSIGAGDLLSLEIVNAGSGTLSVVFKQLGTPNHPTDTPKNFGATRTISGSGGSSPSSLTDAQVTYGSSVPWINLGIENVPANYMPPESNSYSPGGSHPVSLPSWMTTGDLVDAILLGAGGGGGGSVFALSGQGGAAGSWYGATLTVGVDVKAGSTLTFTVGVGGTGGSGSNGGNGGATTLTYTDPSNIQHTITAAGGAYGGQGSAHNPANSNSTSGGAAVAAETYNSVPYYGGAAVGDGSTGAAPGGGGGGAISYLNGAPGADGEAWTVFRQPT